MKAADPDRRRNELSFSTRRFPFSHLGAITGAFFRFVHLEKGLWILRRVLLP